MSTQFNKASGNAYQGANQLILQNTKKANLFKNDAWVTFLQARELGLKIKKGSKSVGVFRGFTETTKKDKKGKLLTKSVPLGYARVFNLDQTEVFSTK